MAGLFEQSRRAGVKRCLPPCPVWFGVFSSVRVRFGFGDDADMS